MGIKTGIFEMIIKLFKSDNKKSIAEFLHFNNTLLISTVIIVKIILLFSEKVIVSKSVFIPIPRHWVG